MDLEEHQDLVNIITGVHAKLRKSLSLTGDPHKVWQEHVAEENLRKDYSVAMLKLATKIWSEKECRIEWSYKACMDYFFLGGLERSLFREKKLKAVENEKNQQIEASHDEEFSNNYENINRKLRLLDVGSCFNPFSKYAEFSCVAVDLTPATKDVLQCDFLALNIYIKPTDGITSDSSLNFYEDSFDIVVLSLVLEYLPASEQRAVFCFKAWKLLQKNGLCIIITPDSKSVHHNAPMMKSWKSAMEKIGFKRVKYDKLTHLHCMAFRKCSRHSSVNITNCNSLSNLLYIPQDFKTYNEEVALSIDRTEEENNDIYQQFLELPNEN